MGRSSGKAEMDAKVATAAGNEAEVRSETAAVSFLETRSTLGRVCDWGGLPFLLVYIDST